MKADCQLRFKKLKLANYENKIFPYRTLVFGGLPQSNGVLMGERRCYILSLSAGVLRGRTERTWRPGWS